MTYFLPKLLTGFWSKKIDFFWRLLCPKIPKYFHEKRQGLSLALPPSKCTEPLRAMLHFSVGVIIWCVPFLLIVLSLFLCFFLPMPLLLKVDDCNGLLVCCIRQPFYLTSYQVLSFLLPFSFYILWR